MQNSACARPERRPKLRLRIVLSWHLGHSRRIGVRDDKLGHTRPWLTQLDVSPGFALTESGFYQETDYENLCKLNVSGKIENEAVAYSTESGT